MAGTTTDGRSVEVIYEGGVFRPIGSVEGVEEHRRARVILDPPAEDEARPADADWALSPQEAAEMTRVVDEEFERNEGEW